MGNYISVFRECIKNSDIKKAKDLLLDLHLNSDETKIAILDELAMVSDEVACVLLDFLMRLEAKYYESLTFKTYERLIQLITDRAHLNFEFAVILYKINDREKILKSTSLIKYILTNCTDRVILFETINAVGDQKIDSLVNAVAEFLYYDDITLKEQAVKNLTKIGSPEVYKILLEISKTVKNDQNIVDALATFQVPSSEKAPASDKIESIESPEKADLSENSADSEKIEQIDVENTPKDSPRDINMLVSKSIEERFQAFNYFIKYGRDYLNELIANLKSNDHDLIVNTLRVISHIPSEELLSDIYSFLNRKHCDPSLEHEAFEALCSFEKFSFTEFMMSSVENPAIHVRMSAIKALNKHYNDPVYAKIKNRIETGRENGEMLVQTIIDAQAHNLINYLFISDAFADMASTYLIKDATPSALSNYIAILIERGLKSTAKKIEFKADMESKIKNMLKVMVISSSDTVQKIYEKLLFKNGYISIGFKSPEEAFEPLSNDKPDLIVSDLFSKEVTALNFAKEVREFYNKNELPFLISTRQNDFLDIDLSKKYPECSVSGMFKFPGIIRGINEWIR